MHNGCKQNTVNNKINQHNVETSVTQIMSKNAYKCDNSMICVWEISLKSSTDDIT